MINDDVIIEISGVDLAFVLRKIRMVKMTPKEEETYFELCALLDPEIIADTSKRFAKAFEFKHWGTKKINCIKILRNYTGLGLKEAKEFVESVDKQTPIVTVGINSYNLLVYSHAYCEDRHVDFAFTIPDGQTLEDFYNELVAMGADLEWK